MIDGYAMTIDSLFLKRWNQDVLQEINRHKWFESEKAGYDIGMDLAAFDWLNKYYENWCRNQDYLKPFFQG